MARAVARSRHMQLWKDAVTGAARLAVADRARQEGDIRTASTIYVSVALKHAKSPAGPQAKQRLVLLAQEARERIRQIDSRLAARVISHPPVDSPTEEHSAPSEPAPNERQELILDAFREYSELAEQYERVPVVARELRRHIFQQRRRPENAAALNEPKAKMLWESGQQYEKNGEACCAYWSYEKAARLVPASSAHRASDRIAEMRKDPKVVASAETCRCIRECHKIYLRAERLIELKPLLAKKRFTEIVHRAPNDSEVYRLAKKRLAEL